MRTSSDAIVVGSGPSGVHAAWPLVEAGLKVTMLDAGVRDDTYAPLIPSEPFARIRRTDELQHRYFLGDRFEGIPLGKLGAGPQLTPPRQFVFRETASLTPSRARGFEAMESLAAGGLGGAWGAVAFPWLDSELHQSGLAAGPLRRHYENVARRIGVSGQASDDLSALRGPLSTLQPALDADSHAEQILACYEEKRTRLNREGFHLGRPLLAALTRDLGERKAHAYHDMDFYSNADGSVYRPALCLRELGRRPNFNYRPSLLVERFEETGPDAVRVWARPLSGGPAAEFTSRRLILAAGALGTTRLVLRSLERYDARVPLVSNPHSYMPSLNLRSLGRAPRDRRHSLAQITVMFDPTGDRSRMVQGQMYSYGSLMLYRLVKELPLPYRAALRVARAVAPHMVIWVVQHEDRPGPEKYCVLRRGAGGLRDRLDVVYRPTPESVSARRSDERRLAGCLRTLGCLPLKTVQTPEGSSIHYAGQFPASDHDRPLTTTSEGLLRPTRLVHIADGAAFRYLPAKGLTLTLMANADRVGERVARSLRETVRLSS